MAEVVLVHPNDIDLSRLCVFATLHGGQLPCVPHRLTDTYRRLAAARLVELEDDTLEIPHGYDVDNIPVLAATITPEGQAVVEAMLAAGREATNV